MPPKQRSGSQTDSFSFEDFRQLIVDMEGKVMSRLDAIEAKVSSIDSRLDKIQAEQIRIKSDVDNIRDIVVSQQRQIERLERESKACNAIFSGIPEGDVRVDDSPSSPVLSSDQEKISYICQQLEDFDSDSIQSCFRIGRSMKGQCRLIKVKFDDASTKWSILKSQKVLREFPSVTRAFGRIYINPDTSFLVRKEERRLRDLMKELRASSDESVSLYIRRGVLYRNKEIVDKIDVANQLF